MTAAITPAARAMRAAYLAADRTTFDGLGRDYGDALWQAALEELEADGWRLSRIGWRCAVCGRAVLLSESSAVLRADGTPAELCDECAKASR